MATVVSFVSLKGGVGKSTLCISLACEWSQRGRRVLIVDVDVQQRSACDFDEVRARLGVLVGPTVIDMGADRQGADVETYFRDDFERELAQQVEGYDLVLIDTPAKVGLIPAIAAAQSDLVVMPCGPNGIEVRAMAGTFRQLDAVRRHRPRLDAAVVICRKQPGTVIGRLAYRKFERARYPVLETELDYGLDYAESIDAGLGPTVYGPASKSAREVGQLCNELERRLQIGRASKPATRARRGALRAVK